VPIKGLEVAIRAAAGSGMTLVIAGDGPERAALERLARACGAEVRFAGVVTGDDKRLWLRAADAFVLPSLQLPSGRSEGLPTALLEAMAHALPVVSSHLPGIAELLESSAALVPAGDPAALRTALLTLRAEPARATELAQRGHAIAERFAWSRIGPQLEDLIDFQSQSAARSVTGAATPFVRVT
jgi:glycosyltransferase involved in cell wall biosynthesis